MKINRSLLFLSAFIIILYSCTHTSGTFISQHGSMAGRSMNGNCMDCHKTGASEGGFVIGGTVYTADGSNRYPNGTIYLHSRAPGVENGVDSIIGTIEVDGVGNFYTTHFYDLSAGVYPSVTSSNGSQAFMQTPTTIGACNSCHGVNQAVITVN